jgi:transposase InsO family protein
MPRSRRFRRKKKTTSHPPRDPRSRRFSDEQRRRALEMMVAGMSRLAVAEALGTTTESLRRWWNQAREEDQLPPPPTQPPTLEADTSVPEKASSKGPHDPGQGLGTHEVQAILALKKRYPSMGPAQIRAQLKRFKAWRLSVRAIARVLRQHGYEPVARGSRPKDFTPQSWEAPWRNAIWQADFTELRIGAERRQLLVVLDDFSRFCVGHQLLEEPTSEAVVEVLRQAIRRHGKCEALYTDRGGPFLAWRAQSSLAHFLEEQLIDHILSKPYRPMGRGKIEALIATLQRELWQVRHFDSVEEAEEQLSRFLDQYNHHRAHMGIDGLTPADRFFGRWEAVRAAIDAQSRKRQAAASLTTGLPLTEEILHPGAAEVLRLTLLDGVMEMRLFGARLVLGKIEP